MLELRPEVECPRQGLPLKIPPGEVGCLNAPCPHRARSCVGSECRLHGWTLTLDHSVSSRTQASRTAPRTVPARPPPRPPAVLQLKHAHAKPLGRGPPDGASLPCQVGEAGQPCGPQEEASRGGRRSPRLPLAPSGLFHKRHESPFRVRHFNLESLSKQLRFAVTETTLSSRQTSHIPARSATRAVCT